MKANKLLKLCILPTLVSFLPTSSCSTSNKHSNYLIDGSNWKGHIIGKFTNNDFEIDDDHMTITYNNGANYGSLNLVIPDSIVHNNKTYNVRLGKGCFRNNQGIVGFVELNKYTSVVPEGCFEECNSITDIIFNVPPVIFSDYCFKGCLNLEHIWIKDGEYIYDHWTTFVTTLGESCFDGCTLSGNLIFTDQLQNVGDWAFTDCSHIKSVNFASCTKINKLSVGLFTRCTWLTSVTLPPNLTYIDDYAFMWCSLLQNLNFTTPIGSIIDLGSSVFFECDRLRTFTNPCVFRNMGIKCFAESETFDYAPWDFPIEYKEKCNISYQGFEGCTFTALLFDPQKVGDVASFAFANNKQLNLLDFSKYVGGSLPPNWSGDHIFNGAPERGLIILPSDFSKQEEWKLFFNKNDLILGEDNWQWKIMVNN